LNIKSIAFGGAAVVMALVLSLGLMVKPVSAATTVTAGTKTISIATNTATGTGACTLLSSLVLTEAAAGETTNGQTFILTTPAGWSWCSYGSVAVAAASGAAPLTTAPTVAVVATSSTVATATTTGVSAGGAAKFTWSSLGLRPDTATSATGNVALTGTGVTANAAAIVITAGGSMTAAYTIPTLRLLAPGATCDATGMSLYATQPQTVPADGSAAWVICALVQDDAGNPAGGAGVTFTVSQGIVSTGTAKTVLAVSNSTGYSTTTYRGQGNANTTDSVVATFTLKNAVATQTITLAAGSGGTAAKMAFAAPPVLAVSPNVTNSTPGYSSPQTGTDVALQVQDAAGLGVNGQVLLLTVDKGTLVANAAFATGTGAQCPSTAKSITLTTAGTNLPSRGGTAGAGWVNFTYCGHQTDAPGKATITAQNVTTSMANATQSISMAGAPAKIEVTTSGNTLNVKVTDAGGNAVADNTTVRFVTPANTGAVSTACATTTNGSASATAALTGATGTVIVSTDWNTTGGAASASNCTTGAIAAAGNVTGSSGNTGSQTISTAATVGVSGTTSSGTPSTPSTPAAGAVSSGSVPAAGGFGFFVYGGPISGLSAATGCPAGTAAFWATVAGEFVTNVPGTTISAVNAAFNAAFPNGIPAGTALLGKCK